MKRLTLILLTFVFATVGHSQSSDFQVVLEQQKANKKLVKKLKAFRDGGIERKLDLGNSTPQQLIDSANSYLGTPHCMGGISHKCIDCSGLLYATFRSLTAKVPHGSEAMARYGKIISNIDSLLAGDLVFFVNTYNTSKVITHSGIYIGDYKFIHTSSKRGVVVSDLKSNYYKEHYVFSTRVFENQSANNTVRRLPPEPEKTSNKK